MALYFSSPVRNMWFPHFRYGQRVMNVNRCTNAQFGDIHFIYDPANGRVAVQLYWERYPTRRQPNHQTFTQGRQNLVEHGTFRATIDDTPVNFEMDLLSSDLFSVCGLAIHQNDHQARRRFVEWAQNEIAVVPDFHKQILFSDEAHFWLNGYVNKQNCRIWSEANPQVYVKTPLHPEKLTVWCALWAGGNLLQKR
ncbi:uncharacterized protein TNCV_3494051 [Trichonephila clavipes]|nr:uncharacterized protein TNCV_3494051 [Trichonephila clavipes]